ncbi:glycosyltransferase [Pinibacter aurantiacus]|uniref:Glycosyltransferase n=1 Tax=Pinibacter aurantiacus TaxID=2851599 RepID=A0A9E2SAY1_9BACT|nr:glycosyltransferase [Pinibacter aurantiacus]MBV4357854.1 glycosyltransferase [Pinibacter aurantiacus]
MKVLHTISSMGFKSGGTSSSTYELIKGLRNKKVEVDILSFEAEPGDKLVGKDDFLLTVPQTKEKRFLYSKEYKTVVEAANYQLFHTNGLWRYTNYITVKTARKKNLPYVISPHGMLYPTALQKSPLQKRLLMLHSFRRDLQNATCLHATCKEEMMHIRNLGIKAPVAIIPNSINIGEVKIYDTPKERFEIGYVGRLAPIKNPEGLIRAFSKVEQANPNVYLTIIGSGDAEYETSLKEEVKKLGIKNCTFKGFLHGDELAKEFSKLSILALPSHSENFGMVVPEALIRGIPVVASTGTPWEELNTNDCGWWVSNEINSFSKALMEAASLSDEKRRLMGENGKRLIEENYSIDVVSEKMIRLYDWLINKGPRPDFVFLK